MAATERIDRDAHRGTQRPWQVLARCQGCGATTVGTFRSIDEEREVLGRFVTDHQDC